MTQGISVKDLKGTSLRELGRQLGMSASYLSQVLHGKRPASAKSLNMLNTHKLDVKQPYLLDSEPPGTRTLNLLIKSQLLFH